MPQMTLILILVAVIFVTLAAILRRYPLPLRQDSCHLR